MERRLALEISGLYHNYNPMRYVRILHNGDPLATREPHPTPHWMVKVRDDGVVWGEVLTKDGIRIFPKDFRLPDYDRFFQIPEELSTHHIEAAHHEDIRISLVNDETFECTFLLSQLQQNSPLRAAVHELIQIIENAPKQGPILPAK
jgi:hypothetical protein